jgi:hypothetical protein
MQEIKSSLDLDAEKKSLDAVGQEVSNSVRGANSELERVQKQVLESAKRQQA